MRFEREAYGFSYQDKSPLKEVYGGPGGHVFIECMRIRPVGVDSNKVVVVSHPIGGGAFLPMVSALAAAGRHVIFVNPRYRGNDTALIMEKCVLDLGAAIRNAKTKFGYDTVTLGGWSGGGSLSLFYQEQAENPTITETPAGDPVDLVGADLPPAQGVMLLAAHISRALTLTEWTDPSIPDEDTPFERDVELNLYDKRNPNTPPYSAAYIARYREAQIARNRRITARVRQQLAALKAAGRGHEERCFTVQGTMADPRWLDPAIDPNGREPGTTYLGDPIIANDGPVGLARFTTLRSWLSQWSYDESRANGVKNAANISCPALVLNNTADQACTPSHAERLFAALAPLDKERHDVQDADHYYIARPDKLKEAAEIVTSWLDRKGL